MRHAPASIVAAAIVLRLGALAATSVQDQQPPQPFRSGTTTVRVDATVIDRSGRPVSTLTADDFEVREDEAVQPVTSFKFLANTGQPSDNRSLPIRSQQHAAAEAARDDVRVFLVFWDEYHIQPYQNALRAREALSRIMLTAFGPTNLVAIMDPLTPSSAIEFSRDRRALADRIHKLEGRRGVYLPPRSAAEEAQLETVNWRPEAVEGFRAQVSVSAIKAAAAHLGTLREGRKRIRRDRGIERDVSGPRHRGGSVMDARPGTGPAPPGITGPAMRREMNNQNIAIDMVRTANDSNTAVHVLDPAVLDVAFGSALMLETLGYRQLKRAAPVRSNFGMAIKRVGYAGERHVSARLYQGHSTGGRSREIKVKVKRGGYEVRARAGLMGAEGRRCRAREGGGSGRGACQGRRGAPALASLNPPSW